jgi:ClpP class serine protease
MVKVMDFSESLRINGINPQIFTAGEYKAMGHGEKPLSDKHEQFIVNDIEKQYLKFKTLVSEYRGGVEDSTMQGQLFSGEEAIKVNLADEIVPDLETVINKLSVG